MAGTPVTMENGKLNIPNDPVIHYIEGDGIGVDITPVMIKVVDASVSKAYDGSRSIVWSEVLAGAYWKMKGGADYIVTGLDRIQDAVAFVAALCTQNNISFKEFPVQFRTQAEWEAELAELSTDYQDFLLATAKRVSPQEVI